MPASRDGSVTTAWEGEDGSHLHDGSTDQEMTLGTISYKGKRAASADSGGQDEAQQSRSKKEQHIVTQETESSQFRMDSRGRRRPRTFKPKKKPKSSKNIGSEEEDEVDKKYDAIQRAMCRPTSEETKAWEAMAIEAERVRRGQRRTFARSISSEEEEEGLRSPRSEEEATMDESK